MKERIWLPQNTTQFAPNQCWVVAKCFVQSGVDFLVRRARADRVHEPSLTSSPQRCGDAVLVVPPSQTQKARDSPEEGDE
jgi:hypothetical protein